VNARKHFHDGPDLIDRHALQGFNVSVADHAPYELEQGFRVFRDCERPNPAIARSPATLHPATGFQPVQDTYETGGIDLADLRQVCLADILVFRDEDQGFALCQLERQRLSSLLKPSRVETSYLVETKSEFLTLVHTFTSSHSGESWVRMMSMASLPSVMTTNIAIRKATVIDTRARM